MPQDWLQAEVAETAETMFTRFLKIFLPTLSFMHPWTGMRAPKELFSHPLQLLKMDQYI